MCEIRSRNWWGPMSVLKWSVLIAAIIVTYQFDAIIIQLIFSKILTIDYP